MHEASDSLAAQAWRLHALKEGCDELMSWCDMEDATTFNREDGVQGGCGHGGFGYGTAWGMAMQRPSYTACAYINEVQLRMIRARSRAFAILNPYWGAVKRNRIAYIVSTGHIISASSKKRKKKLADDLKDKVVDELTDFNLRNRYRVMQGEKITRLDRDGEFYIRYLEEDGYLNLCFIEPLQLQDPPGEGPSTDCWLGVKYDGIDYSRPKGYFIKPTNYDGNLTSEQTAIWQQMVPADEIQRRTANVDMSSPRGLPATYTLQARLDQAISTLKSTGRMVDIRARIALIRKQVNATIGTITPLLIGNRSGTKQMGNQVRNAFQFPYGAIVDTNDQRYFEMPTQNLETDKIIMSIKTELQAVASAMGLADFTISGDSHCHDAATELMTKRGWLKHEDIVYGDEAGTMNPTTGKFEWQAIQQIHKTHYTGKMVRLKNQESLDMLVTPNHRMYCAKRRTHKTGPVGYSYEPYRFYRADEMRPLFAVPNHCAPKDGIPVECFTVPGVQYSRGMRCGKSHKIVTGTRDDRMVPMMSWLPFLGWFVSEGWTFSGKRKKGCGSYRVGVTQSLHQLQECALIDQAIDGMGEYKFNRLERHNTNSSVNGYSYTSSRKTWETNDKSLWSWLRAHCGIGSYHKKIPAFVNDLPAIQQSDMLESLVRGDGRHFKDGHREYYTVSRELADGVQSLAIQCGYSTSIRRPMKNGVLAVVIGRASENIIMSRKHMSQVDYDGIVWCVTVPNGIIITRRNGKMAISGNSNFAAALVKEGPMDKCMGVEQQDMMDDDLEVYHRALRCAEEAGRLPAGTCDEVRIEIQAPPVVARERLQTIQGDEILRRNGAMSSRTMMMRAGLEPEDEEPQIKLEPPVDPAGSGDTRSNQPGMAGKTTARGVPQGKEPGPALNTRNVEGLEESSHEPQSQTWPSQEDMAMAATIITPEWLDKTKQELMALPQADLAPVSWGVKTEYEPGIMGVYMGIVDNQQVWAVDMDAMGIKYGAPDIIVGANSYRWKFVKKDHVLIDWISPVKNLLHIALHELIEERLFAAGWSYARSHKYANRGPGCEHDFLLALRPELAALDTGKDNA